MADLHRIARHEFAVKGDDKQFRVVGFEGTEAISQPYRFEVVLVSDDPEVAFDDVVNEPATLTMYRGDDPSEVSGIVVDFEQSHQAGGQSEFRYVYRAVLAPRLSRLALSHQSRIFPNMTVREIVGRVLDEAGVDHAFKLSGRYSPREYTTQYKETDLAFVQRLLEFEGIRYYFEHAGQTETMVLDDGTAYPPIEADPVVPYSHADGLRPTDSLETIRDFVARQRLVTKWARHKDYDYRNPSGTLLDEDKVPARKAVGVLSDALTSPAGDSDSGEGSYDGRALAKVRTEEIETTRLVMTGTGDCLRFRSGFEFTLEDHYRKDQNQAYLLTRVLHRGAQPDAAEAMSVDETLPGYSNEFQCVPSSVRYRPPRLTPLPKLPGVLTAKVVSGGTYGAVDDQGRYLVQFPFDQNGDGTGKPVRLAQPYVGESSGGTYGQHFPVHTGAEMVVACVDGNVDRIIGLSTVYNGAHASPVTSENPAHSTLRSWGQNELTLDDTQGEENVYLFTTKNHTVEVTHDQSTTVGNDRMRTVERDEKLIVKNDQTEQVDRDASLVVGVDQSIQVGMNRDMKVGNNLTESVGSMMTLDVGGVKTEKVGAASQLTIGGLYAVNVGAVKSESVKGVSSESVGGSKMVDVKGSYTTTTGGASINQVKEGFILSVGKQGQLSFGEAGALTTGQDLTIDAGTKAIINVADQLTLKCGKAEIVLKKNGDVSIKGNKIDLKGSGKMTLKGSQIAEN